MHIFLNGIESCEKYGCNLKCLCFAQLFQHLSFLHFLCNAHFLLQRFEKQALVIGYVLRDGYVLFFDALFGCPQYKLSFKNRQVHPCQCAWRMRRCSVPLRHIHVSMPNIACMCAYIRLYICTQDTYTHTHHACRLARPLPFAPPTYTLFRTLAHTRESEFFILLVSVCMCSL